MKPTAESVTLRPYRAEYSSVWNDFVSNSRNGTFLIRREYMDYHRDRFDDHSLMFYHDQLLIAVLPGNITADTYYSHGGLTYGGLIVSEKATASRVMACFDALIAHLRDLNISKLIYRPIPYIYHRYPSDEDLYALFRHQARLTERKISSALPGTSPYPFSTLRKRKHKAAQANGLSIVQDNDFTSYWKILTDILRERHGTSPTHTLEEISELQGAFPDNILLYRVTDHAGRTIAGCVLYLSDQVAHVQYIAANDYARTIGALELLFHHLIHEKYSNMPYFDFGISVEQGGHILNEGLIFQKEGFGGRGVVYDSYEIDINP